MSETISVDQPAPEPTLRRLRELRGGLLRLHKTLLDSQRAVYEQVMGRVTSGELLQLVINHEQFVWLRSISEFIVRIDEMLDADEPVTTNDAEAALSQARALLSPSEDGGEFGRKYYAALQRDPDAVLAHRAVTRIL
jgi:Mg2+ and Co2+ transporter CorA